MMTRRLVCGSISDDVTLSNSRSDVFGIYQLVVGVVSERENDLHFISGQCDEFIVS